MEDLKKSRGILKSKFTRKCKLLEKHLNDPYEVLQEIYDEISTIFKKIEEVNDSILDLLNQTSSPDQNAITEANNYIEVVEEKKTKMYVDVIKSKSKGVGGSANVKVKSLPHPEFSGDIRKFGTFTKDYDRLMTPIYGRDPYALYKCLTGEAVECVRGVEDNFDSMISRLNTKYANPCKLTDCVVNDIKQLGIIPEGNFEKFIDSVNILERAWLDMSKFDLKKEMNSSSMDTLVERILPRKIFHDWVKISETLVDKSSLFKHLLDFLLAEKRICEYMNSDLRSPGKVRSNNVQCVSNNSDFELKLQEMKLAQDQQNIVLNECISNVSKIMSNVSNIPSNYNQGNQDNWVKRSC